MGSLWAGGDGEWFGWDIHSWTSILQTFEIFAHHQLSIYKIYIISRLQNCLLVAKLSSLPPILTDRAVSQEAQTTCSCLGETFKEFNPKKQTDLYHYWNLLRDWFSHQHNCFHSSSAVKSVYHNLSFTCHIEMKIVICFNSARALF